MKELPTTCATYITHCFKTAVRSDQEEDTWVKYALGYIDNTVRNIHRYTLDGNS
jgi:hypothetical protein